MVRYYKEEEKKRFVFCKKKKNVFINIINIKKQKKKGSMFARKAFFILDESRLGYFTAPLWEGGEVFLIF